MLTPLPIDEVLPDIVRAVRVEGACVVVASPGSGKTTRVPPALLEALGPRVWVLQPRRVAARLAARRVADERGSVVGGEVGYAVRFESFEGPDTRLAFLTEGLLLRRLQADPLLEGVRAVVLDELHERSLDLDLALALLVDVRRARPDLALVALSATLDPGPVAALLGGAPVVEAPGRAFPVELAFDPPEGAPLERHVARVVQAALLPPRPGHVLVFLPGVAEIGRCAAALEGRVDAEILPLHGSLRPDAQDRALAPSERPKVVLATNVAETSVTLEGVHTVVDSGLVREVRHDPALGWERLVLTAAPRSSADQRAGRAGRTGPGRAIRLWSRAADARLADWPVPEVARVDLAEALLQVLTWGARPEDLAWLTPPPAASLAVADALLERLGATRDGALTATGRAMASLPLPPRLARVLLAARDLGCLRDAASVAALATGRDFLDAHPLEVHTRLRALDAPRPPPSSNPSAWHQARQVRDQLLRLGDRGRPSGDRPGSDTLARALLAGFPDRVARRRSSGGDRLLLAGSHVDGRGGGEVLMPPHPADRALADQDLVLVLGLHAGASGPPQVTLALPLEAAAVPWEDRTESRWDRDRRAATTERVRCYGAVVLRRAPAPPDPVAEEALLAAQVQRSAAALRPDDATAGRLARVAWLRERRPELELPDLADPTPWVAWLVAGRRTLAEVEAAPWGPLLDGALGALGPVVDRLAPERLVVPSGRGLPLRYAPGEPPVLAVKIQELFGLAATPAVDDGRAAVRLHLLAPNGLPVQVTDDLAGFWARTWPEVRKELRGRYPRHPWPEDPWAAPPTHRATPRR